MKNCNWQIFFFLGLTICKLWSFSRWSLGNVSNKLSPRYNARRLPLKRRTKKERENGMNEIDWLTYSVERNLCLDYLHWIHCRLNREFQEILMNQMNVEKHRDDYDQVWVYEDESANLSQQVIPTKKKKISHHSS